MRTFVFSFLDPRDLLRFPGLSGTWSFLGPDFWLFVMVLLLFMEAFFIFPRLFLYWFLECCFPNFVTVP